MTDFKFKAKMWVYDGLAAWYFISVPKTVSKTIKARFGDMARGFGSLPVNVSIGNSFWKTSIFPDSKTQCYMLPIKSQIRKKEFLSTAKAYVVTIKVIV